MRHAVLAATCFATLASAQARWHNFEVPPGTAVTATLWNGQPALILLAPAGVRLAYFHPPGSGRAVVMTPQLLAVLDTRPCAVGARYDLAFFDYHTPYLPHAGIVPGGGLAIGTGGLQPGEEVAYSPHQPMRTEWWVSYCDMMRCYNLCPPNTLEPEFTALLVTVGLR